MARKTKRLKEAPEQLNELKALLAAFETQITDPELRTRVRALIPSVMKMRDLGVSLMDTPVNGDNARERVLAYFRAYPMTVLDGDELMVVSGIGEWARRLRELRRQFGWLINSGVTYKEMAADLKNEDASAQIEDMRRVLGIDPLKIKPDQYVLASAEEDREAAHRWQLANDIRKSKRSVQEKILDFLQKNIGRPVQGEELRYLANNKTEWARRVRELRTQEGWAVASRMSGRPDLPVGVYVLEHDRRAVPHDRHIKDAERVAALDRDGHACVYCKWNYSQRAPHDARRFLELHHLQHHAAGGKNTADNLITLCNVHHDKLHSDPAFELEVQALFTS